MWDLGSKMGLNPGRNEKYYSELCFREFLIVLNNIMLCFRYLRVNLLYLPRQQVLFHGVRRVAPFSYSRAETTNENKH